MARDQHEDPPRGHDDVERLDLEKEANQTLGETGMVLPGVLTLFGFQLVVVFNPLFLDKLYKQEQFAHLACLALLSLAGAMVLAPAAFRRKAEPGRLSQRFIS